MQFCTMSLARPQSNLELAEGQSQKSAAAKLEQECLYRPPSDGGDTRQQCLSHADRLGSGIKGRSPSLSLSASDAAGPSTLPPLHPKATHLPPVPGMSKLLAGRRWCSCCRLSSVVLLPSAGTFWVKSTSAFSVFNDAQYSGKVEWLLQGEMLAVSPWESHFDERLFGVDAAEFNPHREGLQGAMLGSVPGVAGLAGFTFGGGWFRCLSAAQNVAAAPCWLSLYTGALASASVSLHAV